MRESDSVRARLDAKLSGEICLACKRYQPIALMVAGKRVSTGWKARDDYDAMLLDVEGLKDRWL